jgi:hypothetical protein
MAFFTVQRITENRADSTPLQKAKVDGEGEDERGFLVAT